MLLIPLDKFAASPAYNDQCDHIGKEIYKFEDWISVHIVDLSLHDGYVFTDKVISLWDDVW